ncbi:hypothetical protein VTI74DRAFT_4447 [Chaetomium olivicolor]
MKVWIGSRDRGVQFWDSRTGQAQFMLQAHRNTVISVAPNPAATRASGFFATGSGDMTACIWSYTRLYQKQ